MGLLAQHVASVLKLENWITHIEVITHKGDVKLIDFGARGGGAGYIPTMIVPNVSGINMMKEFIKILLNEKNINIKRLQKTAVVYRFFTPTPGKVVDIKGIDHVQSMENLLDFHLNIGVGDIIPQINTQLDRAGYFVIKAQSLNSALKKQTKLKIY